jgi:general secretion pathway protein F/type IV pilus assembly protein PilC
LGLTIVATFVLLFRMLVSSDNGKKWWHETMLKLPLFGAVLSARFYAQFGSSLGNLVNNGVPLLNAMKLTTKATPNVFLRGLLSQITLIIGEGVSLSGALRKVGHLPTLFVDMVAMGEQTGRLGHALEKIAKRYDKELDGKIKRLTALVTPVVLILMFFIVGLVAYAIVTSIFQAMTGLKH